MTETRIHQIAKDIENYQNAIESAEGALDEAERELTEELEKYAENDASFENYPE